MSEGPPKQQTARRKPPCDVFSASPGRRASDLSRGDLYPPLLLTKTHMAEITRFWQQGLGVDALCSKQHVIMCYTGRGDKEKSHAQMCSVIGCIYTVFDFSVTSKKRKKR